MPASGDNESGILVYPHLPMPKGRRDQPRLSTHRDRRGRRLPLVAIAFGMVAGGAGAWFLQPEIAPDPRIADAARRASDAETTAAAQKTRADALDKSLEAATKARRDADAKLAVAESAQAELATRSAGDGAQRKVAEAVRTKLAPAIAAVGAIAIEGGEVHLRIADRALFKPNDDELTDRGKAALARLAATLKELPDKQVWIQGHTDDTPVPLPKPPPPAARGKPPPPAPVVRFPTNWELSAARALAVVHYLQDTAKLDASRLTALAFGQYAPISKRDKAANRRIEIVIGTRRPAK